HETIVRVDEIRTVKSGATRSHTARFRQFSLAREGFLAGYDVTNSLPEANSFFEDESADGRLLAVETVDIRNPTSSAVLNLNDWKAGRLIKQLPLPTFGPLHMSPDGKYLAWLSPAGGAIYSLPALEIIGEFKEDFQEGAVFVGTMVALPIWQQRRIRLWDI